MGFFIFGYFKYFLYHCGMNQKIEHTAIKYLDEFYGDLEEYTTDKRPDSVFFVKDKKVYMEHDLKNGYLFVDYDTIWQDLETIFSSEITENQRIITKWVEDTYNIEGVTPIPHVPWHKRGWKTLFN